LLDTVDLLAALVVGWRVADLPELVCRLAVSETAVDERAVVLDIYCCMAALLFIGEL
jgi:hypothetical protein